MDKNQELEGEILNKGIEQGKDLLFEQANTKTLAAELEEISNKKVMCYKIIKDNFSLFIWLHSKLFKPNTRNAFSFFLSPIIHTIDS